MKKPVLNFNFARCVWPIAVFALIAALAIPTSTIPSEAKQPPLTEKDISSVIMSPVCPGYLLINCPSAEAAQLRELIRQMVEKGDSKEKILNYLVEVYGEGVLAEPPKKGFSLLAWILPFAAIINGGIILFLLAGIWLRNRESKLKKKREDKTTAKVEDRFTEQLEEELKRHEF